MTFRGQKRLRQTERDDRWTDEVDVERTPVQLIIKPQGRELWESMATDKACWHGAR